jgi:hypothetical protein
MIDCGGCAILVEPLEIWQFHGLASISLCHIAIGFVMRSSSVQVRMLALNMNFAHMFRWENPISARSA